MLAELHVVDLGIVADLDLVRRCRASPRSPGRPAPARPCSSRRSSCSSAAVPTPSLVRDGADEARVEGRFVDPDTGDEIVLARVVPRDGRSRAYVDGRLATVGELAELGAVARRPARPARAPDRCSIPRCSAARSTASPATDALRRARRLPRRARRAASASTPSSRRLGGDERARAREVDLLRFQVQEIAAAGIDDVGEERVARSRGDPPRRRRRAPRGARHARTRRSRVPGSTRSATRSPRSTAARRSPSSTTRLRAVQAELADVDARAARRGRAARRRSRAARRACAPGVSCSASCGRKYGDTLAEVLAYARRRRRPASPSSRATRHAAAALEARRAAEAGAATTPPAGSPGLVAAAAGPLGDAIEVHLRELAMPARRASTCGSSPASRPTTAPTT